MVFDLNGTLTSGALQVVKSTLPNDMIGYLAGMESQSNHPIAKVVTEYIKRRYPHVLPPAIDHLDASHTNGLCAEIAGETMVVGNHAMMLAKGIDVSRFQAEVARTRAEHVVFLARGQQAVGYLLLHCPLRPDARATVTALKRMGKQVHLCTGADAHTSARYARALGILPQQVQSNCSANEKLTYINTLRNNRRRVAMVGDAVNDEAAFDASQFSVAVKSVASDKFIQQKASAIIHEQHCGH